MSLLIKEHSGHGLNWGIESDEWKVGIKNFKVENSLERFDEIEKHLETEEVFILLDGSCILYYKDKNDPLGEIKLEKMEKNKLYILERNVWHNMITQENTKLVLIENQNTSMENSIVEKLSKKEKEEITFKYKKLI